MKCRNIFLGTAFTNYPFLWNTAGFICFKKTNRQYALSYVLPVVQLTVALRSEFQRKSCSNLQEFALLEELN